MSQAADAFEALWPTLAIPGEYDAMDACDQARWRGVIEAAFEAGADHFADASKMMLAEREACARVCEEIDARHIGGDVPDHALITAAREIRQRCNAGLCSTAAKQRR